MKIEKEYIKIPELSVPAKDLNVLNYAVAYGADSIYIGGQCFNLRSYGENFNLDELEEAEKIVHKNGKKLFFTLNAIINENEIDLLKKYLKRIKNINFDAIIITDPGIICLVKENFKNTRIHLSTQLSTSNHLAVNFWENIGIKRVNLARELTFNEVKDICNRTNVEIEVFVHGALCISYSGRCLLSKYLTGRDANKGTCAHSCRWKYYLLEEKRPNLFLPIIQDKRGTYILNSRDLCLIKKMDLISSIGVSSVKIEGRMKTENYVGTTTWAYRKALDLIAENKFSNKEKEKLYNELEKISHRTYTEGFMFEKFGKINGLTENDNSGYIQNYKFLGIIDSYDVINNGPVIIARNHLKLGTVLSIIQPYRDSFDFKLSEIIDYNSKEKKDVVNTNDKIIIPNLGKLDKFAIIKFKQ